jgi:hypothetical protein
VRGLSTKLWAAVNERTVCIAYRWLALALAGLLLVIQPAVQPRDYALLGVAALVNIGLSLNMRRYVQLAWRYPAVLLLDLVFGLTLIALSTSSSNPFQLYAYSALVLPALLWGWRSGCVYAALIAAGNLAIVWFAGGTSALATLRLDTWLHLATPFSLALLLPPVFRRARQHQLRRGASTQRRGDPLAAPLMPDMQDPVLQLSLANRQPLPPARRTPDETPAAAQPDTVRTAAEHSSHELRRAVFGPMSSSDVALEVALGRILQSFGRCSSVTTSLSVQGTMPPLQPAAHHTLLRLAQEALLNVEQHARASSASVTLQCEYRRLLLTVQDDGVGLLDGTYQRPGMHALRAVAYRLAELGGRLDVRDDEGGGLLVQGSVPLNGRSE